MRLFGLNTSRQTLAFIAQYAGLMLAVNFVWEIAQLPLYTLWENPDFSSKVFALVHCTIGDALIAVVTLTLAVMCFGNLQWPVRHYWRVAVATLILGVVYTVFSEWLNIGLRQSWAYRDSMPVLPPFGTGLSPLLQWMVLPLMSFGLLRKIRPSKDRI